MIHIQSNGNPSFSAWTFLSLMSLLWIITCEPVTLNMHGSGSGSTPSVNHTYYSSIHSLRIIVYIFGICICLSFYYYYCNIQILKIYFILLIKWAGAKFKRLLRFIRMKIILLIYGFYNIYISVLRNTLFLRVICTDNNILVCKINSVKDRFLFHVFILIFSDLRCLNNFSFINNE